MKLAFIHFYTLRLPRGIETLVISLANELSARGHDVSILTARTQGARTSVPVSPRVRLEQFPVFRFYEHRTIQPFYARDLLASDYDAVIVFFADFGEQILTRIHRRLRAKIAAYWCYSAEQAPHRFQSYRQCGLEEITSLFLADSRFVAESAGRFFGRPVDVVPVGTDSSFYRPDAGLRQKTRADLRFGDSDFVLLNMAALERAKGAHLVVQALPLVREQLPDVRYLVLGAGPEEASLRQQVEALGLQSCVRFLGTAADILPFYNAADCFVLLSEAEANSVAMHEAMSCGVPVVVSDTGGVPEVVDETCGRMVDRDSPEAIAGAVLELAADPPLRERLGAAARQKIVTHLSWASSARTIESLLQDVVGSAAP